MINLFAYLHSFFERNVTDDARGIKKYFVKVEFMQ